MNDLSDSTLAPRVRVMQIIAFALITGVVVFLSIVCFLVFVQREGQPLGPPQELPILTIVALVMLIGGATMSLVLPMMMTRAALQRLAAEPASKNPANDNDNLLSVKQTALIVSMALLEGPAFMGCIALLIEARQSTLGLVSIAIVGMVIRFPTQGNVRVWLFDQTNKLDQLRQGGDRPIKPR